MPSKSKGPKPAKRVKKVVKAEGQTEKQARFKRSLSGAIAGARRKREAQRKEALRRQRAKEAAQRKAQRIITNKKERAAWLTRWHYYKEITKNGRSWRAFRNLSEFKEAWLKAEASHPGRKVTAREIRAGRRKSVVDRYKELYRRAKKAGYVLADMAPDSILEDLARIVQDPRRLLQMTLETTYKQANNFAKHAKALGIAATREDFLKDNAAAKSFWQYIDQNGGWKRVFGATSPKKRKRK